MSLVTIPNVPILTTGTWALSSGTVTFTTDDLAAAAAALDDPAIRPPYLKLGHEGPLSSDQPALGRYVNLRLEDDGHTLVADIAGVPEWLAAIMPTAYPSRSIEGDWDVTSQSGRTHRLVIHAVSLLGVAWPGVAVLEDLQLAFEAEDVPPFVDVAAGIVATRAEPPSAERETIAAAVAAATGEEGARSMAKRGASVRAAVEVEDLRRAYYEGPAKGNWWWIRAVRLDPPDLIVDDDAGSLYRVGWAIDGDGFTFEDPVPVVIEYVDAGAAVQAAAGTRVTATYASRAESRPDGGSTMDGAMLREKLGLAADATEEDVQAALDAAAAALAAAGDAGEEQEAEEQQEAEERTPIAASGDVVNVDRQTWESVRAAAERGSTAADALERAERERTVEAAVSDGRIPPARRDHWLQQLAADPGAAAVLASLAPGLVPVAATELGSGRTGESSGEGFDDKELSALRAYIGNTNGKG